MPSPIPISYTKMTITHTKTNSQCFKKWYTTNQSFWRTSTVWVFWVEKYYLSPLLQMLLRCRPGGQRPMLGTEGPRVNGNWSASRLYTFIVIYQLFASGASRYNSSSNQTDCDSTNCRRPCWLQFRRCVHLASLADWHWHYETFSGITRLRSGNSWKLLKNQTNTNFNSVYSFIHNNL